MLIVGDVDHRFLVLEHQTTELWSEVFPELSIEVAHRLIQQINLRVTQECSSQSHALSLPPRKLGWFECGSILQLHQLQHMANLALALIPCTASYLQTKLKVCGNAEMGEECITLEDHSHLALNRSCVGDVFSLNCDRAIVHLVEAGNQTQRGAFAAATGTHEGQAFAIADVEVKMAKDPTVGDAASKIVDGKTHPLTAPLVKPETIDFWNIKTSKMRGMEPSTVAAA